MDWLQLLLSALVAAVVGPAAAISTATRISRANELGRVQEEARQRMLADVRLLRSRVSSALADATWRSAMNRDYLSEGSAEWFAEAMERNVLHSPTDLATAVRERVARLVGPVQAHISREVATLPRDERPHDWHVAHFFQLGGQFTPEQLEDHGLMGRARSARIIGEHVIDVVTELDRLEETLQRHEPRLALPRRGKR